MPANKTVVITGANSGIGFATAIDLAKRSYNIITICRRVEEGSQVIRSLKEINPSIVAENFAADLSSLVNVRTTAQAIIHKYPVIDRLINNAGYYPAEIEYIGGIEKSFFASHLGHMLLTQLLQPALMQSDEARVINVSSALHTSGKVDRFFKRVAGTTPFQAYADAKLANILFTSALSKQMPSGITSYSLHPGVVRTNFGKTGQDFFHYVFSFLRPFFVTPAKGALTSLYLADAPIDEIRNFSGGYFSNQKPAKTSNKDINDHNVVWLWEMSNQILNDVSNYK